MRFTQHIVLLLILVCMALTGCSKPVTPQQIVGRWKLVASSHTPMKTVIPNDLNSGWVHFRDDMTYEMVIQQKQRPMPAKRSGRFTLVGNTLQTVSGVKITESTILFQDAYLVTVTKQKAANRTLYIYYLPDTQSHKTTQ